jgi:uncharacterized membrane protein YbhN (UPF0104 family)
MTSSNGTFQKPLISTKIVRATSWFLGFGVILYLGSVLFFDRQATLESLSTLGISTLIAGALLSSTSYLWRFARWLTILRTLEYNIPIFHNFLIYLSGLALTATPGKAGETFRSALLLPYGVRVPHSLAAFVTDRATDVLGVVLLGCIATALVPHQHLGVWTLAFIGLLTASILFAKIVLGSRAHLLWAWLNEKLHWIPTTSSRLMLESWARLWALPKTIGFTILATIAYGTQALVFVWFSWSVGVQLPIAQLVLIFVQATLFGAASMLPGGLGAMEAALVYQLMDHGVQSGTAISLAIAIRLVTLWFGMFLGGTAMLAATKRRLSNS